MKKVLFATTALVATAGVAAADVTLSGSARFGLLYVDTAGGSATNLTSRYTLNITGTTQTDNGLTLSAKVRIRGNGTTSTGVNAAQIGVSTGGLTMNIGNINGALESTPGLYAGAVGLTGLGWYNLAINNASTSFNWMAYSSAGGFGEHGIELIYAQGAFGVHVSYLENTQDFAISGSYNFGNWTVAAGYEDFNAGGNAWTINANGSLGDFGVGIAYGENAGVDKFVINGSYAVGAATTITGYIGSQTAGESYGIGVTHGLGGGATIAAGIAHDDPSSTTRADAGIRFQF